MKLRTDELIEQSRLDEDHSSFSSAEETFNGAAESTRIFSLLKNWLSDIDSWNAHSMLSTFTVFDENGREIESKKLENDYFLRILLKGTMKYDWVRVIDIYDSADEFIITVKPTYDPTAEKKDKTVISHFFTSESTNNFCLARRENSVALYVIGLNEKMNSEKTSNALETVRNAAVNLGSYLGVQRGEWEKFCHHLMDDAVKKSKP